MFDRDVRYITLADAVATVGSCPVCCKAVRPTGIQVYGYSNSFVCTNNHDKHIYMVRISNHKYSGKTRYRISNEMLTIPGLLNVMKHVVYNKGNYKQQVILYEKNAWEPYRKYSLARFQKIFKPNDKTAFMEKLASIQKAINLFK